MSVCARINRRSLFKEHLGLHEIIEILNLPYGSYDGDYRLQEYDGSENALIYENNQFARGIELSLEKDEILLTLNLPTTLSEIRCFYDSIEKICQKLKKRSYLKNDEKVLLKEKERLIKCDAAASIEALRDIEGKLVSGEYVYFEIFGVCHPISIGLQEINEISQNLDCFAQFLDRLQSIDAYYATPRIYRIEDRLVGIYVVGPDIQSIVPIKPSVMSALRGQIEEWYILFGEERAIKYCDFIEHVKEKKYYDANHVLVALSNSEIESLTANYDAKLF